MTEHTTAGAQAPAMLAPPETLAPVAQAVAADMVPLAADASAKIDAQVTSFVASLATEDIHSDVFRARLDSAFRLGREEISSAAALMTGRFMQRNFVGIEDSSTFKALHEMRTVLDDLNPGKQGDLLQPNKIFGLIPFGNKLQQYFRKYQAAGSQLQTIMGQVYAARDDMQRDAAEIEQVKGKLWDAMLKLKGAIRFAGELDSQIAACVSAIAASDPLRAKALEQEVLFYARQNLLDMQTQMAVNVNGYLAMDVLKKTAREMVNGCNRVATTGMSALATAQTVARATGNQVQVMDMLQGVSATIGALVTETSRQLGSHVQATGDYASNPMIGVEQMQAMFDNTFKAMDAMDTFRSQAIDAMGKNNEMIKHQVARSEQYLERARSGQSRDALAGGAVPPVVL
jgi:uncharacterized protein YaaN involved in tellurite resistance